jgi:hypothetical protein
MTPGAVILGAFMALGIPFYLKIPLVALVAPIAIARLVYPQPEGNKILSASVVIAVGGPVAFDLLYWFPGGGIGIVLGFAAFWIITSCTLDYYFDVHYDQSYAITGHIVAVCFFLWVIAGAVLMALDWLR